MNSRIRRCLDVMLSTCSLLFCRDLTIGEAPKQTCVRSVRGVDSRTRVRDTGLMRRTPVRWVRVVAAVGAVVLSVLAVGARAGAGSRKVPTPAVYVVQP